MIPAVCWKSCLDIVLPPVCLLCGEDDDGGDLCPRCDHLLHATWPPRAVVCRFCGLPAPPRAADLQPHAATAADAAAPEPSGRAGTPTQSGQPCPACPPGGFPFAPVTALAVYQGPVREAVVAAKRAGNAPLAAALGVRLANQLLRHQPTLLAQGHPWPDCVTFVPTALLRRLQRGGTSGAACLAAAVARRLDLPAVALVRQVRPVAKQSLLPDDQRRENVRGAFAANKSYPWRPLPELRDRHILLVDDVLTTGSTATEVTGVLLQAGAASVHLAVVARAVRR